MQSPPRLGGQAVRVPRARGRALARWRRRPHLPAPGRLWTDKNVAEAQAREHHAIVHHHGLARRLAPAPQARNAGVRQLVPLGVLEGVPRVVGAAPVGTGVGHRVAQHDAVEVVADVVVVADGSSVGAPGVEVTAPDADLLGRRREGSSGYSRRRVRRGCRGVARRLVCRRVRRAIPCRPLSGAGQHAGDAQFG